MKRGFNILFLAGLLCLALPAAAGAHGMTVRAEPGAYLIRVQYDDGTPVPEAVLTVKGPAGDTLAAEGLTDGRGRYFFAPPGPGVYQVTARDGLGHRERLELLVDDAAGAAAPPPEVPTAETLLFRALAGLGYLVGLSALAWWYLHRRAAQAPAARTTGGWPLRKGD